MASFLKFLKFMVEWGLWEILSLFVALGPLTLILVYLFPRKAIKNLYIDAKVGAAESFPRVVVIELRNHTNAPLYVLSEGFKFGSSIRPSPLAAKDVATGLIEIKFEGRQSGYLSEIDVLIRPNQIVNTWIPVHPDHSPADVIEGLQHSGEIGELRLKVQKISTRPHPFTALKIPI
jgi:hypothetical protein